MLYLTGLELLGEGSDGSANSSSSSNNGAALALPLWAFRFNRSAGSPNLHLFNVTLELPLPEFSLLLVALRSQGGASVFATNETTQPASFLYAGMQVRAHTGTDNNWMNGLYKVGCPVLIRGVLIKGPGIGLGRCRDCSG